MDRTAIKQLLLTSHQTLAPADIVLAFTTMYPNTGTASSQLSRFKRQLKNQTITPIPSDEYLQALKLSTAEYTTLTTAYTQTRDEKSRNSRLIEHPDLIAEVAQLLLQSDDFRELWPACIVVSGLRPADLLTVIVSGPNKKHEHEDFWVSISNVAKKKPGRETESFEHPLLAPRWLFLRALGIVREYFLADPTLSKEELSLRYSSYWQSLVNTRFGFVGKNLTHVLFRRFFAKYAYHYFKSDFLPAAITEHGFISFALMHDNNEPALAYGNIVLDSHGTFDLFTHGRTLTAMGNSANVSKRPRVHVDLGIR